MEPTAMRYPFEASFPEVQAHLDHYVAAVFSCLESEFLVMPKGEGFIEYPVFEQGYEALKKSTGGFNDVSVESVFPVLLHVPISLIVLRTMVGFTPSEWAYVANQRTGVEISQGFSRSLDRKIRMAPLTPIRGGGVTEERLKALVKTACLLLKEGPPAVNT